LAEDVRRDGLTGLLNRRALAEDLPELDAATGRDGARFAFALCDVDHFKAYNDCLGHLAGDQALRDVSAIIRTELRAGDGAYRYGGEEILIVLRGLDAQAALAAAERVRQAVSAAAIPHPDGIGGVLTLSCGVASGSADAATVLARADAALYVAKDAGRNGAAAATADLPPVWSSRPRPRSFADPMLRHLRGVLEVSRAAAGGDVIAVTEALAANIRRELPFRTVAVNLLDATGTEAAVVAVVGDADAREPLLLPLRAATGDLIGVVAVDEPETGLRPDDTALEVLMTVASHGALAIEQAQRAAGRRPGAVLVR
jgi:diguanylate cyclase (GGDEF)-like protein